MRIVVASDHAGRKLRAALVQELVRGQHAVEDLGPNSDASVDYPDFAKDASRRVASGQADFGVLTCGSGVGMSIAANKVHGVRAALCRTPEDAALARGHNNANVLCLGERVTPPDVAVKILETFLKTPFDGGRHQARVDKISAMENDR